jgi:hypothetical protein
MSGGMTRAERQELSSLIRKREKVMKARAQERSAALLAEFDAQSAKIYSFDDDAVWAKANAAAHEAIDKANQVVAERCRELGILEEFAPGLNFYWHGRGHNAVAERRAELRRAAKSKIEAIEKEAVSKIERMSLEAQTEVIASGLESQAAKDFLNAMPSMEKLMPPVLVTEIQSLVETRKAERRTALEYLN